MNTFQTPSESEDSGPAPPILPAGADRPGIRKGGIPASSGIVIGPVRVLNMEIPPIPHTGSIPVEGVEAEIERFRDAVEAVKVQIKRLQDSTRVALGAGEAQIFEPQLLMLEDASLVGGTESYIRENHLTAERAFEWRMLEWEAQWSQTAHPMVLEKLNDLGDVQGRVFRHLMGLPEPDLKTMIGDIPVIVVAHDLTPSIAAQLSSHQVLGLATEAGTRTSHSSILARSLQIPCVVSVENLSNLVEDGVEMIVDGRAGLVVIRPSEAEKQEFLDRDFNMREWEQELLLAAHLEPSTKDGVAITLRGNIDLPGEAAGACDHGAQGIGLFRTEFLVVGRNAFPPEEEQYDAYVAVLNAFKGHPVVIRTYDLGGDKFPGFLHIPKEENPFLGWRAIRLCLDEADLFRAQLRALIRARSHGDLRIMLPMVTHLSEVLRTRELLDGIQEELRAEGLPVESCQLGAMIETPAAALIADSLAKHVDFFSIGTNDLVQYALAVDRGSARLAHLYNPFHPGVLRLIHHVAEVGMRTGVEVAVCGELAAHPLGAFLLIGMGIESLSVGPAALAEIKNVIRSINREKAKEVVPAVLAADSPEEVIALLRRQVEGEIDLDQFAGAVGLWAPG